MGCFTFEELLAGLDRPELPEPIRRHVTDEACDVCARRLELLRRLLDLLPSLALEKVPESVLAAALKARAPASDAKPHFLEAILPAPWAVPAFRSGSSTASRRQLYRKGPFELDLALQEDGALLGEVVADDGGLGHAQAGECILYGERAVEHAEVDSEGCFRFEGVGPGSHVLVIESGGETLVVPDLEFRA